jgi:hypothetical protein
LVSYVIRVVATAGSAPCLAPGQYVVRVEFSSDARLSWVVTTPELVEARRWPTSEAARRFWATAGPAGWSVAIDEVPPPGRAVCDFCSAADPIWVYPATDFEMQGHARGSWAACAPCAGLIELDDWHALAERYADASPMVRAAVAAGLPDARRVAVEAARLLHARFRQARTAEPRRPLPA